MKKNTYIAIILIALVSLFWYFGYYTLQTYSETIQAKNLLIEEKKEELKESNNLINELLEPTPLEVFQELAKDSKKEKLHYRKSIEKNNEENIEYARIQRIYTLQERCYLDQALRVINELPIEYGYCMENYEDYSEVNKEPSYEDFTAYRKSWGIDDKRNKWISYAYENSGYSQDMILTFASENDSWGLNRPSDFTGYDGKNAYGFCQLYPNWHQKFISSQDFQDPYKQLDYCIGVWKDAEARGILAETFHAYPNRELARDKYHFNM